jgi:hypothetical protein
MRLDHIVVSARTLDEGAAHVERVLGQPPVAGGRHGRMATHNRLLGLGDCYLEVIATDPTARPPGRARWFDLDRFADPPRLTHWVAACDDLAAELARAPGGTGEALALARGNLRWHMAVPGSGTLPYDDCYPALLQWQGEAHPLQRLPDGGLKLIRLRVMHPRADALAAALCGRLDDPRLEILGAPAPGLAAEIATAAGPVWL